MTIRMMSSAANPLRLYAQYGVTSRTGRTSMAGMSFGALLDPKQHRLSPGTTMDASLAPIKTPIFTKHY